MAKTRRSMKKLANIAYLFGAGGFGSGHGGPAGAIIGLSSVLLVLLYGQSRIFFAMSRDGLLPPFFSRIHPRFRTTHLSTILVGGLAVMGDSGPLKAAAAGDIWVAYPLNPAPGMRWLPWAWVALGALGTLVQMRWTGGDRGRIGRAAKSNKKKPPKD